MKKLEMKTRNVIMLVVALIISNHAFSQERARTSTNGNQTSQTEKKKTVKEVDQANQTAKDINVTVSDTGESIEETVDVTKRTVEKVIGIFGKREGTKKERKPKNAVFITIGEVAYDEVSLNKLYQYISQVYGSDKVSKVFTESQTTVTISSKITADVLWQEIPEPLRKAFTVNQMSQTDILLHLNEPMASDK